MTWRSLGMALVLGAATVASTGCTTLNMRPLSLSAKNPDADPIAAKVAFARLCERHGQGEQARQTYQSLLKTNPRMQVPLHRLAVMSAKQGKFDEAEAFFEKALAADAPSAELLSDHGYCLYLEDRLDDAERVLRDAMTLDPRYKAAKVNLGLVLGQQERLGESYAAFKDAVGESQALANMAYVQAQRNDFQQAEMLYSRALSHDPEMRSAALALVQLNDIKKRQQDATGVQQAKASEPIAARQPNNAVDDDELVESRRPQPMTNVAARNMPRKTEPQSAPKAMVKDSEKKPGLPQSSPATVAEVSDTASRDFVPRQRVTEIGHEWRTGEASQQRTASTPANTQVQPAIAANKPTDNASDDTGDSNSRSIAPRQRVKQMGQNWGTGETLQPVNVSVANSPRQSQAASEQNHEEHRSTSASTSPPIQVTTRQAEKGTTDGTAKMTVTMPSPGATAQTQTSTASSSPAAQPSATSPNPQVIDMTQVRGKAGTPTRTAEVDAPISISLLKKPSSEDKSDNRPKASAESAQLPLARTSDQQNKTPVPTSASPTVHSAPQPNSVSQKAPEAKSATQPAYKTTALPKSPVAGRAKQAMHQKMPLTPPAPPVPPSRNPSKSTEFTPVSTQTSAAMISDSPAPIRSSKSATTSGANAPARLDSKGKGTETPSKPSNTSNDGQSPRSTTMQSESSAVRYVEYRDTSAARTQRPANAQPSAINTRLDDIPNTTGAMPSAYPSTNNPTSLAPNGPSFQGARILTPASPQAAMFNVLQPPKSPAKSDTLPGYAGASDSP